MVVNRIGSLAKNVKLKFALYVTGLILCPRRKTCVEIGKMLTQSHDSINRTLQAQSLLPRISLFLKDLIYKLSMKRLGWLIIDDTLINKLYAKYIEGIEKHFDSSDKSYRQGFSAVVLAWTNGKKTIPLDFEFWFSKELVGAERYRKKIQIAQFLIKKVIESEIEFKGVILDGLYASRDMIKFLNNLGIIFEMRMHSNRVITLPDGKKIALKDLTLLRMTRNQHSKTIRALWHGIELYFTSELRIDKTGKKSIVFIVSNWEAKSSEHVRIYSLRWAIEMFFRAGKQYLGLQHCTARSIEKQKLHIFFIFYSYAFLQVNIDKKKFINVESIIKYFRDLKPSLLIKQISAFNQNFTSFA